MNEDNRSVWKTIFEMQVDIERLAELVDKLSKENEDLGLYVNSISDRLVIDGIFEDEIDDGTEEIPF